MYGRSGFILRFRDFAVLAAVFVIITGILAGCAKQSDTILIGEYNAFQGPIADFGKTTHNGIALAIEEINNAGGLLGKKVELKSEDDRGDMSEARTAVEKLITRDRVVAVLGEVASSNTLAAAPVAQTNKVPMITPSSTNPKVTSAGEYIFRVCFTDDFQGAVVATFAAGHLEAKRAAIFRDVRSDYSKGLADAFKKTFAKKGGAVVIDSTYSQGDPEFKSQLTSIKSTNPDLVFIPGYYTEVSLIAAQARQLGIRAPLIGGDGWDSPSLLPSAGGALEGCYFSNHFTPLQENPAVVRFVQAYERKYNTSPNALAALGYDAAWILAEAIKKAGSTDGDAIRQAVAETRDYPGVTGQISIDSNRNASKPAVVVQIKGDKFVPVASITPEDVK
ncbi:MAG: ABC transporter substrate-binding protein [Armatimonadetes bacterium]|nr:ABC transporter substrate-binding protein [Armatimonadota bacterium]